jgi:hypothetical protein
MLEGQNKEICKSIYHTTMINPSKDIHVQMQKKLAASLVDNGLHCFASSGVTGIVKLNQQYRYIEEEAYVKEEGQRFFYVREFHSIISNNKGYFNLEQFSEDEDLQPIYIYITKRIIS